MPTSTHVSNTRALSSTLARYRSDVHARVVGPAQCSVYTYIFIYICVFYLSPTILQACSSPTCTQLYMMSDEMAIAPAGSNHHSSLWKCATMDEMMENVLISTSFQLSSAP